MASPFPTPIAGSKTRTAQKPAPGLKRKIAAPPPPSMRFRDASKSPSASANYKKSIPSPTRSNAAATISLPSAPPPRRRRRRRSPSRPPEPQPRPFHQRRAHGRLSRRFPRGLRRACRWTRRNHHPFPRHENSPRLARTTAPSYLLLRRIRTQLSRTLLRPHHSRRPSGFSSRNGFRRHVRRRDLRQGFRFR